MSKEKMIAAAVTLAIVVVGGIIAAIVINKVQPIKDLTTK